MVDKPGTEQPDAVERVTSWAEIIGPVSELGVIAERWGTDVETLREQSGDGELFVLITKDGTEVVPVSHLGESGVINGLPEVTKILHGGNWSRWTETGWLAQPFKSLEGRSVIEWLREGRDSELPVQLARALVAE